MIKLLQDNILRRSYILGEFPEAYSTILFEGLEAFHSANNKT